MIITDDSGPSGAKNSPFDFSSALQVAHPPSAHLPPNVPLPTPLPPRLSRAHLPTVRFASAACSPTSRALHRFTSPHIASHRLTHLTPPLIALSCRFVPFRAAGARVQRQVPRGSRDAAAAAGRGDGPTELALARQASRQALACRKVGGGAGARGCREEWREEGHGRQNELERDAARDTAAAAQGGRARLEGAAALHR